MLSLLKDLGKFDIILASESPRRFELLQMIGLNFTVRPSHIEETYRDHLTPLEYALDNAKRKSGKVAEKYPASLIIAADTIVIFENEVLEKPMDEQHAFDILNKLSGRTHEVITAFGLCRKDSGFTLFDHEITRVRFRSLTGDEIHAYIKTGEPFDKAGGYGAQGYGSLLIERVEGCFFNVVGLPLAKFYTMLNTFCTRN